MSTSSKRVLQNSSLLTNRMNTNDTNATTITSTNSPAKARPVINDQVEKEKENHQPHESMMAIPMPSFLMNSSNSNSNSNSNSSSSSRSSSDSNHRYTKADRTTINSIQKETKSSFFIDTDMLAKQLAAAVSDETRLSNAILDLIPPPVNHDHHHMATTAGKNTSMSAPSTSNNTPRNNGGGAKPLTPPPGLLKALSPPKALLPELSSKPGASPVSIPSKKREGTAITTTTVSNTSTKPTLPAKRKALDLLYSSSSSSCKLATNDTRCEKKPAIARSSTTGTMPSSSIAREKTMKEPQSGDLYECVITKRNGGLGLTLACVDDHVQITGLAPDTPAASSGIAVGDTLVAVSGLPVRGLQFSTVISRLKSASRNSVDLKLRRNPFRHHGKNTSTFSSSSSSSSMSSSSCASRQLKRPTQATSSSSSSSTTNSVNILHPKTQQALENRLVGATPTMNGSGHVSVVSTFQIKSEESCVVSSDAASILSSSLNTTTTTKQMDDTKQDNKEDTSSIVLTEQWHVDREEKERYYEECRALKQEMASLIQQNAVQKRHHHRYSEELRGVFDSIQQELKQRKLDQQKQQELTIELQKAQEKIQLLTQQMSSQRQAQVDRTRLEIVLKMDFLLHELTLLTCTQRLEGICPQVFDLIFGSRLSSKLEDKKEDTTIVEMDLTWTQIGQMVDIVRSKQKVLVTSVLMLDQYVESQKEEEEEEEDTLSVHAGGGHFKMSFYPQEQALEIIFQQ